MSDLDRSTSRTLMLLAQPGAYEALLAMHTRGGTATFTEIATKTRQPLALMRSMASEGFVVSPACGTLDVDPHGDTRFCLTAKGEAVLGHLVRLQQWINTRDC
ncbi:hypothetical protein ACNTMW_33280 [Planosporangium sp. 12N6]|uniref:hypothetical protein n=1 Tax=Planosporangium spinosum TaxID=3402278 RepID=UPI003CF9FCC7